jgi:uncharacterized integral membrane protein
MYVTLIITFILVLLVTIFGLQNGMPLEVKFLFWNLETSLITVIFGSTLTGGLIVAVLAVPKLITKHFREKKLTKKLDGVARLSRDSGQTSPPSA